MVLSLLLLPAIRTTSSRLADLAALSVGVLMVITGLVAIRIDARRTQRREQAEQRSKQPPA